MNSTIVNLLENSSSRLGPKVALQIKDGENYFRVTYQELSDASQKIAQTLRQLGIKPSDTLGLITENSPYWGMAFFGSLRAGGTVVPIDNKLKDHSILNIVEHAQCKVIFTSSKFKPVIDAVIQKTTHKPIVIILDEKTPHPLTLQQILSEKQDRNVPLEKPKAKDLAIILYTSGTSGSPKGVMLTHGNIASNVESVTSVFPFSSNDQFISVLPLCHTYAITADFLIPIYAGSTVTYVENLKGPILLERMHENKATVLIAVPALIQMLYHQFASKIQELPPVRRFIFKALRALSKFSLLIGIPLGKTLFKSVRDKMSSRLKFFISGGAPIDPKIIQEFFYLGIPIYQGYGLTETSPILTVNTPSKNRIGSVGPVIPGVQIQIVNGEIVARGPNIMQGYLKNLQATSEVLREGWFSTGDLGHFDAKGFLHITGRLKNVIVTRGGKNVYPEELEEELSRSLWIKEACVIGIKKESKGFAGDEQVYALLVPNFEAFKKAGIEVSEPPQSNPKIENQLLEEIKSANTRLADYKRIRGMEVWLELPKTTTLKIKRKEISDILRQRGAQPIGGELN